MPLKDCELATPIEINAIRDGVMGIPAGERAVNVLLAEALLTIMNIDAAWAKDPKDCSVRMAFFQGRLSACLNQLHILGLLPETLHFQAVVNPPTK